MAGGNDGLVRTEWKLKWYSPDSDNQVTDGVILEKTSFNIVLLPAIL